MLQNSFIHVPSVGAKTENLIWQSGITCMDDFLKEPPDFLSTKKIDLICKHIKISNTKITSGEPEYFYSSLTSGECWRIFKEFRNETVYLDIETTGLGGPGDIITTIALYDGKEIFHYVNGINLSDFVHDIQKYKVIVSYNGKTFDVPFIENYFGITLSHTHLDLRFILRSLGVSGGLKSCEFQLGIGRSGALGDVDGFFAILLWREYKKKNDIKALETLLAYNIQDTINLEYMMVWAYNEKLNSIPFTLKSLEPCIVPDNPFEIDSATVNRIKNNNVSFGIGWGR